MWIDFKFDFIPRVNFLYIFRCPSGNNWIEYNGMRKKTYDLKTRTHTVQTKMIQVRFHRLALNFNRGALALSFTPIRWTIKYAKYNKTTLFWLFLSLPSSFILTNYRYDENCMCTIRAGEQAYAIAHKHRNPSTFKLYSFSILACFVVILVILYIKCMCGVVWCGRRTGEITLLYWIWCRMLLLLLMMILSVSIWIGVFIANFVRCVYCVCIKNIFIFR